MSRCGRMRIVIFVIVLISVCHGLNEDSPEDDSIYIGYINDIRNNIIGESSFLSSLINAIVFSAVNNPSPVETTVSLAQSAGYVAEEHEVQTADNYILTIHRIHNRNLDVPSNNFTNEDDTEECFKLVNKGVIFLQHGLMGSSDNWVTTVKEECLAYQLADRGYDVWLGNFRGSIYSRGHVNLTSSDSAYWKFSFDEMAEFDLPAMIKYVVKATNSSLIEYIGHSMGSCAFFASASTSNFLETHIKSMIALAPVAEMSAENVVTPIKYLAPLAKQIQIFLRLFGNGDELLTNRLLISLWEPYRTCKFRHLCDNLQFLITGFNPFRAHKKMVPLILSHNPAGASTQTLLHFAQMMSSGKFRKYDWGGMENLRRYGQPLPPTYDITKVNIPVTLFSAPNDWFIGEEEIVQLEQKLPKLQASYRVRNPDFSHLDFLFAIDVNELVYDKILRYYDTNEAEVIQEKNAITYAESARMPREFSLFQTMVRILLS